MMDTIELGLDEIKVDFSTYGYRKQKDLLRVQQYREILDVLPPVDVFDTPLGMVLVAGHHRYDAHVNEGRQTLRANLHQGSELEARLFAIKSNVVHGLPLTRAERKQALRDFILISKEENPKISDRDIATAFGACSHSTVLRERRELVKEELLPLNADELANLDGYITQHSQMLDAEIADVFGCHRSTVFRRRQDLLDSVVLEPESVAGASNEAVQQNEENDDQGDLFQTGGEPEEESSDEIEPTSSNDEDNNSATSGEDSVQKTETAEEPAEASTDMVASSPTDPVAIRLRQENEDKKAYADIVLWLNNYARELGGFNLKFNGLIRKHGIPKIATALEVLNTEHRVDDLATQCYLILEKIEKVGGKADGKQVPAIVE